MITNAVTEKNTNHVFAWVFMCTFIFKLNYTFLFRPKLTMPLIK